jgi:hypothetical protein
MKPELFETFIHDFNVISLDMDPDGASLAWTQARAVADASELRVESDSELSLDFRTRAALRAYDEAKVTEEVLREEIQQLEKEKSTFTDLFDQLLRLNPPDGNRSFWDRIHEILSRSPGQPAPVS